jgi:predicted Zn-dependent protease
MKRLERSPIVLLMISCFLALEIGLFAPLSTWRCELGSSQFATLASVKAESAPVAPLLPLPQIHPLPGRLAAWRDTQSLGDYFDQVTPTDVGYLIWSTFPVRIFVENRASPTGNPAEFERSRIWQTAILQAVKEWNQYLPLAIVAQPESADILIWRSSPPLQPAKTPNSPRRVRSAETRYELYARQSPTSASHQLAHRCIIQLRPSQSAQHLLAAARHELGHALGIWGHSPLESDALYFAQVRHPPPISKRDINTLKRVYQQPTRLGWALPHPVTP